MYFACGSSYEETHNLLASGYPYTCDIYSHRYTYTYTHTHTHKNKVNFLKEETRIYFSVVRFYFKASSSF